MGAVVVDEGDGAYDRGIGRGGALGDETIADEIAEGFGAIGVAAAGDGAIELCEESGIEGDSDAAEFTHEAYLSRRRHRVARWEEWCYGADHRASSS